MNPKSLFKQSILLAGSVVRRNRGSKILYYHDVYVTTNFPALDADVRMGTHIDVFKKHVDVIRSEGYEIVPRITKPTGQVAIMLDDGFRGIWECRRFFYDNNICPTVFLPVKFIGRTDLGIMTAEEILELQRHGFIFECHSWSHEQLTDFDDARLRHELADSRAELERMLSKPVRGFCMPLGYYTDHLLEKIREAGYDDVYCCIPGNYHDRPEGMIPRNLCQYATPQEVRLILRGGNELLKSRYRRLHDKTHRND